MRFSRVACFLLLTWLLACGCAQPATPAPQLRVMTYNIHTGIGTDNRLDLPRVAQVIARCRPDVVALQEVDVNTSRTGYVDQACELARLTGMQVCFARTIDYMGGMYGIGILSIRPLGRVQVHSLPQSFGREPRVALAARIHADNGMPAFTMICTHLDHAVDEQNSLTQAQRINSLFANSQEPMILAGDMNRVPASHTVSELRRVWQNATEGLARPTFPSTGPARQIDYVWFRPGHRWRVIASQVIDEPLASDHCPLLVILEHVQERSE